MSFSLIADSGATKCDWCLVGPGKKKKFTTTGISPYFLSQEQIVDLLVKEVAPKTKDASIADIHFYGTGLGNSDNAKSIKKALKHVFPDSKTTANTDILAAAKAVCGHEKGVACILGTGSNSCFFNGKRIVKIGASLGYILGDEGSGAYLGKKVLQYYLYRTFDEKLTASFEAKFATTPKEIIERIYKQPFPNRYLASFTIFLAENRGHYMVENIIEDGLNDFFYHHLNKYRESWKYPIHFVGSVAFGFKDILKDLCNSYEFELGRIMRTPMEGLVSYHSL